MNFISLDENQFDKMNKKPIGSKQIGQVKKPIKTIESEKIQRKYETEDLSDSFKNKIEVLNTTSEIIESGLQA